MHAARFDRGGHKNPPSAPPAIPPIIITPFNKQIPNPAIDPRSNPPGPPIVPPRVPGLRMVRMSMSHIPRVALVQSAGISYDLSFGRTRPG